MAFNLKDLEKVSGVLKALSNLGALGVFLLNVILVLGLVKWCSSWKAPSDPFIEGYVKLGIVFFAFACLIFVYYVYKTYRRVDRVIIPEETSKKDSNNNQIGEKKNHND